LLKRGSKVPEEVIAERAPMDRDVLHRGYSDIHQRIKRDKGLGSGNNSTNFIHENLRQADQLHGFVQKPRDHAKDAGVFEELARAHEENAMKVASNQQGRTILDLVCALRATFALGDDPQAAGQEDPYAMQWRDLIGSVDHMFKVVPQVNCMLGPLDAQPKAQKPRQQRQKRQVAEVTRPDELQGIVESEKQETDRNMEEMWNVLMRGEIPVAELVCNHQSFSQTVENMFTLAFLVRDGRVQLLHNPDVGMIARRALTKHQKQQLQQQQADSSRGAKTLEEQQQFVIALTQEDWQDMTRVVRKEDCAMKHRQQEVCESQAAPNSHTPHSYQGSRVPASASEMPDSRGPQSESQRPQSSQPSQVPPSQAPNSGGLGLAAVKREGGANKRRRTDGQ